MKDNKKNTLPEGRVFERTKEMDSEVAFELYHDQDPYQYIAQDIIAKENEEARKVDNGRAAAVVDNEQVQDKGMDM